MATGFRSLEPLKVRRSRRGDRSRGVTSGKAGRMIPLAYVPLLREDRLVSGRFTVSVEMAETVRPLANAVYANFEAWFVPFASFDRFDSLVEYNRAYTKRAGPNGVPSYINPAAYAQNDIYRALGLHHVVGAQHNPMLIEAYNTLVNFAYGDRSPAIPSRLLTDTTLATGFWAANRFAHIVPNYDRSFIDGVVPVQAAGPVRLKGLYGQYGTPSAAVPITETDGTTRTAQTWQVNDTTAAGKMAMMIERDPNHNVNNGRHFVRVDMDGQSMHVSLTNIDLARQEAAFDAFRNKLKAKNTEDVVELLMSGIAVPEELERQPWLLAARQAQFGFTSRFATDGPNLENSVTTGVAGVSFDLTMPRTNVGGVVMVVATVVPDQMFERKRDPFLAVVDHDQWPEYERDTLDVDKVDNVLNADIDTSHATPGGLFGYEPMNHKWQRDFVRIGGRMHRPSAASAWVEDRAALWVTEPVNPTLAADFYLAKSVNADPFKDKVNDHLTILTSHECVIEGSTVFGPPLLELAPV